MKFILTLRGLKLKPHETKKLEKYLEKLAKHFVNFAEGMPELSVVLKYHKKNHFYNGTFKLVLPRKNLIMRTSGHAVKDIIHDGFAKTEKKYESYKSLHFKGYSKYPNHESIRTNEALVI